MKRYFGGTPQGLAAIVEMDVDKLFELNSKKNQIEVPLILVVSNLRDPGNMGTLIRTSLGCGITKFLCLKRCAHLLKSKVIRSTAGSIFQIPFIENLSIKELEEHIPNNARIYLAESNLNPMDLRVNPDLDREDDFDDHQTDDESLNRENQQINDELINHDFEKNDNRLLNDKFKNRVENDNLVEDQTDNINQEVDRCIANDLTNDLKEKNFKSLRTVNYLDVNYFAKPDDCVVLIVNGETGVSSEMFEFIKSRDCTRINIPLANGVDSLNSSVAGSLLLFEIKRQYLKKFKN